jgi:signal transduction histidine kinase
MATIPLSIAKYVRSMWMAETIMTYLHIDEQGNLIDWGGYPQHYGLTDLTTGESAIEQVNFLDGMLNVPHTQVLRFIRVGGERSAHVHIIPHEKGVWVLIFDATTEHEQQQQMQQHLNELSILGYRQSQLLQELETARQQLVGEKYQLEKVSELKSQLITTLSQELRTPLNSIVGYTKLLDEAEEADALQANYLASVKNNANHLLSLIDSVLDQATLEAGRIELNPSSCDVRQMLNSLRTLFLPNAQEKNITFEIDILASTPAQVILDELAFRQILTNLITNALKLTKKGFVRVSMSWQEGCLEFAVSDSGAGISTEAQQKIFTTSHSESTDHDSPGAELGLAISHHLVKLMEGELTIESSLGKGSTFKGFVQAPIAHILISPEERSEESQINAVVLVADDNADIRNLMEIYLEEGGYMAVTVSNGNEAILLAQQLNPDLILMDLQMPGTNGYEAVKKLRADHFTQPIIALSASNLAQDKSYALEVGCDHYLNKPIFPDELLKAIKLVFSYQ